MKDMVVDYTLKQFWVPDLHPRSQERPPMSGRVPDFFENIFFRFLDVSFFLKNIFREQNFEKVIGKSSEISEILKKFNFFFFTFFNVSGRFGGLWKLFFRRGGA